jgi:hypothetical protein
MVLASSLGVAPGPSSGGSAAAAATNVKEEDDVDEVLNPLDMDMDDDELLVSPHGYMDLS